MRSRLNHSNSVQGSGKLRKRQAGIAVPIYSEAWKLGMGSEVWDHATYSSLLSMGDGAADSYPSAGEQNLDSCASFSTLSISTPSNDAACGVGTIPLLPEPCSSCFWKFPHKCISNYLKWQTDLTITGGTVPEVSSKVTDLTSWGLSRGQDFFLFRKQENGVKIRKNRGEVVCRLYIVMSVWTTQLSSYSEPLHSASLIIRYKEPVIKM